MNGWYIYFHLLFYLISLEYFYIWLCIAYFSPQINNKLTEAAKRRYINWLIIISLTPYICIYVNNFSVIPLYSRASRCLQHIFDMVLKAPENKHVHSKFSSSTEAAGSRKTDCSVVPLILYLSDREQVLRDPKAYNWHSGCGGSKGWLIGLLHSPFDLMYSDVNSSCGIRQHKIDS